MPERSEGTFMYTDRGRLTDCEPGYDWIAGRFGPPPGIPRERKLQLDRMTDKDYMTAVLRMGQEEKESLMISEAERLRTYRSLWPNPPCVSYTDLAREGFYYTGVSDRVQCAFCAGFLANWEAGDIPKKSHLQFFGHCKMVLRKPCPNLPLSDEQDNGLRGLQTELVSTRADKSKEPIGFANLGISNEKPSHPRYKLPSTRLSTFRNYSSSHPMTPEVLSEAGFCYEGPGDKVRCFWCDGALELWSEGDEAWVEHAKWYPGCGFLQQVKGKAFIKQSRSLMSAEEQAIADSLQYASTSTEFLAETQKAEKSPIAYDTYKVCRRLGFTSQELDKVFNLNQGEDFSDVQTLLNILFAERDEDCDKTEMILKEEQSKRDSSSELESNSLPAIEMLSDTLLGTNGLMTRGSEISEADSQHMVVATTCRGCNNERVGAALLPCGHLILCHHCSRSNIPETCSVCGMIVRGACRTYLC